MNELGIQPHVVEAVLNHISGQTKAGVAGVYNRAVYAAEKRAALQVWADHLDRLLGLTRSSAATVGFGACSDPARSTPTCCTSHIRAAHSSASGRTASSSRAGRAAPGLLSSPLAAKVMRLPATERISGAGTARVVEKVLLRKAARTVDGFPETIAAAPKSPSYRSTGMMELFESVADLMMSDVECAAWYRDKIEEQPGSR